MKICKQCSSSFIITEEDKEFYQKISPIIRGKKYFIPEPSLCPDCRSMRRLSFRNERKLYQRKCSKCNKDMISIYAKDTVFPVYCYSCYWDDNWDGSDYGQDFDFSKTFLENFSTLQKKVPRITGMVIQDCENSDFTNWSDGLKDCYLIFASSACRDCYYSSLLVRCENCMDCFNCTDCQFCYQCVSCSDCYETFFSKSCSHVSNSMFCENCQHCDNCLFCTNLRQKQYYYHNKQVSKEEFIQKKKQVLEHYNSLQQAEKNFHLFKKDVFFRFANLLHCENASGNNLIGCKNAQNCFDAQNLEDCKYIVYGIGLKDCYDMYAVVDNTELSYECMSVNAAGYRVLFSMACWDGCRDVYYSELLKTSHDCFGCIGLKRGEYCILNKKYTKEEYEKLLPKIIEHMMKTEEWGEFFPPSLSSFGYNETVANEYYPLTKEQALGISDASNPVGNRHAYSLQGKTLTKEDSTLQHGSIFNWSDYESPKPDVKKIIPASKLPDDITKIPDDILNWAIECEITKKPFRIIKQELEFYRQHNLPIPRRHPDQRHRDRLALRNPRKLFQRNCMNCNKEIQTTYAPDRKEIVYCEECYLKEVY